MKKKYHRVGFSAAQSAELWGFSRPRGYVGMGSWLCENLCQPAAELGLGATAAFFGRFRDFGHLGDLVGVQCRGRAICAEVA
jgi:hypothetical protein